MALMLWTDDFSVGVDSLDADHIMIFSLINHVDDANRSGDDQHAIGRLLKVLLDVAEAHFQREEKIMLQNGYPDLEAHVDEHRIIIEDVQALYAAYNETQSSEISHEIAKTLCAWLEEHILETDMQYRPYVSD